MHHAWPIEDLLAGQVRVLIQETQNGSLAKELAKAIPDPAINGHREWLGGLIGAVRSAKKAHFA